MDCIFCKIAQKEVPNYTVYEDAHVLAFLDIHPHSKGHTVVIPKAHVETIAELSETQAGALLVATQKAMAKLTTILRPDGFNTGWNQGRAGGQVIPHLHIHIFPRWSGDGGGSMHSIIKNPGDMSVAELAKLL